MPEFDDPRIGNLTHSPDEYGWVGTIELPLFAQCRQSALDRVNRRLAEQFGGEVEPGDEPPDDLPAPGEPTRIRIHVVDTGSGRITPAQKRTLEFLLEHEAEVLDKVLDSLFETYQSIVDDLREFHEQSDEGTLDELVPEIRDPDELTELISFGAISLWGDAIDGYVSLEFWGACTWDEEHGFEIEILKDRAIDELEESEFDPFPYTLPDEIDLSHVSFNDAGECLVEFRIHGAWTGIYRLNSQRQVLQRVRPCLYCKGRCWDAEGIDAIREVPPTHRRLSSTPAQVVTGFSLSGGTCLAPLLIVLGVLAWPGFFWGALFFSAASTVVWATIPTLPRDYRRKMIVTSLVIVALSIAGLVAWYQYDAFADISFAAAIGWIIWTGAALAGLFAASTAVTVAIGLGSAMGRPGLVLSLPFLIFASVVGVAVWKTYNDAFSKFHLLWIVPLSFYLSVATGLSAAFAQLKLLGKQLDDVAKKRRGSQVVDAEVDRKPKEKLRDDSNDDDA